jgi:ABC-2 type transport system permease protein
MLSELVGAGLLAVVLYFVGHAAGDQLTTPIKDVSTNYFDYLITGIAFTDLFTFGMATFPGIVRDGQSVGTLETLMLTHSRLFPIVLYSSLFQFFRRFIRFSILMFVAIIPFGLWHHANLLATGVIFLLALFVFGSLGILSAAFVLVLKQGDPIVGIYTLVSIGFGGLLFPVSILPSAVRPIAFVVPLSHALNGIRLALKGTPLTGLGVEVFSLLVMIAIFLPAGILMFNWAVTRAKREGSLGQY